MILLHLEHYTSVSLARTFKLDCLLSPDSNDRECSASFRQFPETVYFAWH